MKCYKIQSVFLMLLLFFSFSSHALEITHYEVDYIGSHNVTVALKDLNEQAKVECIIRADGKPVGKGWNYINGVGTISIQLSFSLRNRKTTASCSQVK